MLAGHLRCPDRRTESYSHPQFTLKGTPLC
nr:MAG TPA: Microcompartment protein [Caudoviricetes sp.]